MVSLGIPAEAIRQPSPCAANNGSAAIAAALQIYDLCCPEEDATVSRAALQKVLMGQMGKAEQVDRVMRQVSGRDSGADEDRYDFLSYWNGMDRFLDELSGSPPRPEGDTMTGMREFRDGVLRIWAQQGAEGQLSSKALLELLEPIRGKAAEPDYWDDVIQVLPTEDGAGLMLSEVSEAVCVWLREALEGGPGSEAGSPQRVPEIHVVETSGSLASPGLVSPDPYDGRHRSSSLACGRENSVRSCGSERSPMASPGVIGRRSGRWSVLDIGKAGLSDVTAAGELIEVISHTVSKQDETVHKALSRLNLHLESMGRTMHAHDEEVVHLRRSNETVLAKKRAAEDEVQRLQELADEAELVADERDQAQRKVAALQGELHELGELNHSVNQELEKFKNMASEAEQKLSETKRLERQWRDQYEKTSHDCEVAEGHANTLREEIAQLRAKQSEARGSAEAQAGLSLKYLALEREHQELQKIREAESKELSKLRSTALDASERDTQLEKVVALERDALEDREALASARAEVSNLQIKVQAAEDRENHMKDRLAEVEQAAQDRERQLKARVAELEQATLTAAAEAGPPLPSGRSSTTSARSRQTVTRCEKGVSGELEPSRGQDPQVLEQKVQVQQAELKKLRNALKALLDAKDTHEKFVGGIVEDEERSPQEQQLNYRCKFLEAQVDALVRHGQEMEELLDVTRERLGAGASPDVKRRLSIQRMQEEGTVVFNEMSEQLYTLQVQKSDADQELRKLQVRVLEQDEALKAAKQREAELSEELRKHSQDKEGAKLELKFADRVYDPFSGDSDTRSAASGTPGNRSISRTESDTGGWFCSRPASTALQRSPKQLENELAVQQGRLSTATSRLDREKQVGGIPVGRPVVTLHKDADRPRNNDFSKRPRESKSPAAENCEMQ